MRDFEEHGYWWLPQAPEKRIAGTIVYGHTKRAELQLLGSFVEDDLKAFMEGTGETVSPEIVLGITANGKKLTLYRCLQSGAQITFGSFVTQTYLPSIVLEGRHFTSDDEIVFRQVTLRLSHLGEWYQVTGRSVAVESAGSGISKLTMTHQNLPATVVPYEGGSLRFALDSSIKFARFSGDYVIGESACVSVCPDSPGHMHQFIEDHVPPIVDFITMGVGRRLSLLEFRAKVATDCPDGTEEQLKKAPTVQLYWAKQQDGIENRELSPHDMVCCRTDMKDSLELHLRRWVNAHHEIRPVMQLFFGRVLESETGSSNSFLNSIQATEAYHRYRRGGADLAEDQHQDRLSRILGASPQEHRDWLGRQLRYSNEVGLRKRLKELLTERKELLGFSSDDINKHAHRMTEVRNHLIHYSGEKDPDFATGEDFYVYQTLITWTILGCLLEESGIEREHAHALILRNQSFLFFRREYLTRSK